MRVAIIFCLSLFFLLFEGSNGTCATRISPGNTHIRFGTESKHVNTPFHKNTNLHTQKDSSTREITYVEENQGEDDSVSRIATVSIKQVASFHYTSLLSIYKTPQKLALPYCEHLSYTSSFKYLLLRVFRI